MPAVKARVDEKVAGDDSRRSQPFRPDGAIGALRPPARDRKEQDRHDEEQAARRRQQDGQEGIQRRPGYPEQSPARAFSEFAQALVGVGKGKRPAEARGIIGEQYRRHHQPARQKRGPLREPCLLEKCVDRHDPSRVNGGIVAEPGQARRQAGAEPQPESQPRPARRAPERGEGDERKGRRHLVPAEQRGVEPGYSAERVGDNRAEGAGGRRAQPDQQPEHDRPEHGVRQRRQHAAGVEDERRQRRVAARQRGPAQQPVRRDGRQRRADRLVRIDAAARHRDIHGLRLPVRLDIEPAVVDHGAQKEVPAAGVVVFDGMVEPGRGQKQQAGEAEPDAPVHAPHPGADSGASPRPAGSNSGKRARPSRCRTARAVTPSTPSPYLAERTALILEQSGL